MSRVIFWNHFCYSWSTDWCIECAYSDMQIVQREKESIIAVAILMPIAWESDLFMIDCLKWSWNITFLRFPSTVYVCQRSISVFFEILDAVKTLNDKFVTEEIKIQGDSKIHKAKLKLELLSVRNQLEIHWNGIRTPSSSLILPTFSLMSCLIRVGMKMKKVLSR